MEIISNNKTATNTVEVEFKASAEEFEQAVQAAYLKRVEVGKLYNVSCTYLP